MPPRKARTRAGRAPTEAEAAEQRQVIDDLRTRLGEVLWRRGLTARMPASLGQLAQVLDHADASTLSRARRFVPHKRALFVTPATLAAWRSKVETWIAGEQVDAEDPYPPLGIVRPSDRFVGLLVDAGELDGSKGAWRIVAGPDAERDLNALTNFTRSLADDKGAPSFAVMRIHDGAMCSGNYHLDNKPPVDLAPLLAAAGLT